jgi:SPFH domain/Band 7 family protein
MTLLLILLLVVILAADRGVPIFWERMTAQKKTMVLLVLFLVIVSAGGGLPVSPEIKGYAVIVLALILMVILAAGGVGAWAFLTGLHRIPADKVGIVDRKFGRHHPGEEFPVRVHGSPGVQAATLQAGRRYFRHRLRYRVEYVPVTEVPPETIGVVYARYGAVSPPTQTLCRSVSCDSFQDARAFLLGGGQMGRQIGILTAGTYAINPHVFEVLTAGTIGEGKYGLTARDLREISIPEGMTGVVVALEGAEPDDGDGAVGRRADGHENFQLASEFLRNGGQRGAQAQTLNRGGIYRINPWFARVVLIPVWDMILEWSPQARKPAGNYDSALDSIVVPIEGYRLRVTMSQTLRIPAQAAPLLVGRFGEQGGDVYGVSHATDRLPVQRFVERVLGRVVEGYFQTVAKSYTAFDFVNRWGEVGLELEDKVVEALAEWGVVAVRTTLNEYEVETGDLEQLMRQIADARESERLLALERTNADTKAETLRVLEGAKADAEIAPQVRLLEAKLRLLGNDQVERERLIELLTQMGVPKYIGADASQILQYMPLQRALDVISQARNRSEPPAQADATVGMEPREVED